MTKDELREKLAAIEHERWADWQRYLHGTTYEFDANGKHHYAIPPMLFKNWERQINTPYSELSDVEKVADMQQVDRYWPLIEEYIKQVRKIDNDQRHTR